MSSRGRDTVTLIAAFVGMLSAYLIGIAQAMAMTPFLAR